MSFKGPYNINVLKRYPVRMFDGIGGDSIEVLRRFTGQGYDISYTVSNEMQDFDLSKNGVAQMRDGCRKISHTGKAQAIDGLNFVKIGGILAYCIIFNGTLTLVDIPLTCRARNPDKLDFTPATTVTALASTRILTDPSYPV